MKLDAKHEEKQKQMVVLANEIINHLQKQSRSAAADGRVDRVRKSLEELRNALERISVKEDRAYWIGFAWGWKKRKKEIRAEERAKESRIRADERARLARRAKK